jgi:hypothetical protein
MPLQRHRGVQNSSWFVDTKVCSFIRIFCHLGLSRTRVCHVQLSRHDGWDRHHLQDQKLYILHVVIPTP